MFGEWPIATKTPCVAKADFSPVRVSSSVTPVTPLSPPWMSTTAAFSFQAIFGLVRARSSMIRDARNSSRRWTIVTFVANFVRKLASSIAVSPPPTTMTSLPLKKKPSQVAQAETPWPIIFVSASRPSSFAEAPEDTMTASAVIAPPASSERRKGRLPKSTSVTVSSTISVPNRLACSRKTSMSSGPWMPSR